jgi:hypothetical protein
LLPRAKKLSDSSKVYQGKSDDLKSNMIPNGVLINRKESQKYSSSSEDDPDDESIRKMIEEEDWDEAGYLLTEPEFNTN